ncbi:10514_t:CDS:2, partial [Cetraspora pellucida]
SNSSSQQTITNMLRSVVPYKGTKKLSICRTIAEWLIIDNQPFEVISGERFRRFMLQIDPAFRCPSYKALKKEISLANINAKKQINDLLEKTYTLQLSVNCVFRKKHEQISCIQSLVKFFDSPKQSQRLDTAQIEVSKKKTKEIFDNSSDKSKDHSNSEDEHNETTNNNKANINKLLELCSAIRWLLATLTLQ